MGQEECTFNRICFDVYLNYTFQEALMKASIVDLRYKMNDVLKALKRNEQVKVYYRDSLCGIIIPPHDKKNKKKVEDHAFFGMHDNFSGSVADEMDSLRGSRYKDI